MKYLQKKIGKRFRYFRGEVGWTVFSGQDEKPRNPAVGGIWWGAENENINA